MSHLEDTANLLVKAACRYAQQKDIDVSKGIRVFLKKERFIKRIASILAEAEALEEESLKRYALFLNAEAIHKKEVAELYTQQGAGFSDATKKCVIGYKIISQLYYLLRRLEAIDCSDSEELYRVFAERYLGQVYLPEFKAKMILSLQYPYAFKIIEDNIADQVISFAPFNHQDIMENLQGEGGWPRVTHYLSSHLTQWMDEELITDQAQKSISLLCLLSEKACRNESFIAFLNKNPSKFFTVFSDSVIDKFLEELVTKPVGEASEMCISSFITRLKQKLEAAAIVCESIEQSVGNAGPSLR